MNAQSREAQALPKIIMEAYAAQTKPPLTDGLRQSLEAAIAQACHEVSASHEFGSDDVAAINGVLDHFETDLDAISGPRLLAVDAASGTVQMSHRSEAGHPLRAFGGQ